MVVHRRGTMSRIRSSPLLLSLLAGLVTTTAHAQVAIPTLPEAPVGGTVGTLLPDQWYASGVQNGASVIAAGYTASQNNLNSPAQAIASPVQLATPAGGASGASASVAMDALSVHSTTTALASDPATTPSGALTSGSLVYQVFLSNTTAPLTLDLNLNGSLLTTGGSLLSTDPTRAGVAVAALGSLTDAAPNAYTDEYLQAGIDPTLTGRPLLEQLANFPTTQTGSLTTFGALAAPGAGREPSLQINDTLSVTAQGTPIVCPAGVSGGVCGTTWYWFAVTLLTGAENGASANFGHTLVATDLQVPAGTTISFASGEAIPLVTSVPEPSTWASFLAGTAVLAWLRRRREG